MKKLFAMIAVAIVANSQAAWSADEQVSADDPIVQLFEQARSAAVTKIQPLMPCNFPESVNVDIKNWIMMYKNNLVSDIKFSPHVWLTDIQPTCAFTKAETGSTIYFSYPACRRLASTLDQATGVLIRESTHHLGVTDEVFTNLIADAIGSTHNCPDPENDVFNPAICQGPAMTTQESARFFDVGSNVSRIFASPQMYQRVRHCNKLTGCKDWVQTNGLIPFFTAMSQWGIFKFSPAGNAHLSVVSEGTSVALSLDFPRNGSDGGITGRCGAIGSRNSCEMTVEGTVHMLNSHLDKSHNTSGWVRPSGILTNSCMRFAFQYKTSIAATGDWAEEEDVIFARF